MPMWELIPEAPQVGKGDASWALAEYEERQSWPGLLSVPVSHVYPNQTAGFANVLPSVPSPEMSLCLPSVDP